MKLYTIGHGNQSIESLIRALRDHDLRTVVDVRTVPHSRYCPQFNREDLEGSLALHHITYAFAGRFLGGRPSDPTCYKRRTLPEADADYLHEVDYPEVMRRDWFLKGVNRLLELARQQPTTVLCSEVDPARCHRHHLIARYLIAREPEVDVWHIGADGSAFRADTIRKSVDAPAMIQHVLF